MVSGMMVYWVFNRIGLIEDFWKVLNTLILYILLSLVGFRLFHTYTGIMRYSSFVDLMRVIYSNGVSLILVLLADYFTDYLPGAHFVHFTTTQICLIYLMATLLMWLTRVMAKTIYDVTTSDKRALRVLIYGAMSGGVGLAKNINTVRPKRFILKGFISHNPKLKHTTLMGEKVYNLNDDLKSVIKRQGIEAVLVSPLRQREFRNNVELQDILISAGVKIFMAEGAKEWNEDDTEVNLSNVQLKEVSVEDLLPREEIQVDMKSVGELLKGKKVLITGSAGSIGSEMVRQIAIYKPACMILIDQAETPQHDIRLMMAKDFPDIKAEVIVTSISRQRRMNEVFEKYRPDYVFHAAAYKHVPMMEDNPSEAVLNNIWGTKIIADNAVKYGVKKFVMVSTDKAVNPTNVMGCSKRICEIYVQSLDRALKQNKWSDKKTRNSNTQITQFVTTRFGNVLGSNGSVIPLFREQIKNGGPVTVTHPDIIRFFMLIPEACKLVLEAGTKGNGGEIFVFDMGKPVRIADLANRMIRLSGAKNIEVKFTGLRAGEKLYEEVLNEMEGTKPTFHNKIRIAEVRQYDYEEVNQEILDLIEISKQYDDMATVKKMKEIVPEYKSNNSKYEQLDS
jgi:FlaA1/EpsC-like NDP-sugar epimerase